MFLAGLVVLVGGAELMVRAATRVATLLGVSPMVIGLTVVAIGTSTPELAVGAAAAWKGEGGMAVGNIAGTNIANLLLIMCLSAAFRPLPLHLQIFRLELPTMVVAAILMAALAWDGDLSRRDGALMLLAGVGYTVLLIRSSRKASATAKREYQEEYGPETVSSTQPGWRRRAWEAAALVVGIALTVGGAELLVRSAVQIAEALGVSMTIIGLTIVAIGTSAPELATTLVSTFKNDRDVAVGNLLGSSIYNILAILSITCMVSPASIPVERELLLFDIPLMAGVAIGAIPIFITGKRISRLEGGLGLVMYLAYMLWIVFHRV